MYKENLAHNPLTYRLAVGCFFFIHGTVFSAWANRIPDIKRMLGLNDADWGTILFALPFGQFTMMWLSGLLVAKFGSRNMARCGLSIFPLILILVSQVGSSTELFITLMAFGAMANLHNISINTQAVDVELIYGRSIMASFHGIWSVAGFCGGIISGILVSNHISPFIQFSGVAIFAYFILFFISPFLLSRDIQPKMPHDEEDKKPRGFLHPTPLIFVLGFTAFGSMSCEGIMFDWSVIYFENIVHAPIDMIHTGYIAFMLTMASGRFVGDRLIMRFGAMNVLGFSGLVIFCGMMSAVLFPGVLTATIGFLMVGAGVSSVVPTCYSMAGRSRRMKASIAIATVSTIGFLGFLMGPPLIGYVAYLSNLRISFAIMACIGLLVTLLSHSKPLREAATGVYSDSEEVEKELLSASK